MIEIDYAAVGERIARYRKLNGLTAAQLAVRVGDPLTRDVLAKIENGRRDTLDTRLVLSIAWALRVPPIALIFPINRPSEPMTVDGRPYRVGEMVDWFNGWKLDPHDVWETTNAGLEAAQILNGLQALSRLTRRYEQMLHERRGVGLDHRELTDMEQDIRTQVSLLQAIGVEFETTTYMFLGDPGRRRDGLG